MPGHYGKGMKGKKSGKMNGLKKATKAIAAKKKMKAKKEVDALFKVHTQAKAFSCDVR